MNDRKRSLLVVGLLALAGTARAAPAELRLVYTSETVGELNPCG